MIENPIDPEAKPNWLQKMILRVGALLLALPHALHQIQHRWQWRLHEQWPILAAALVGVLALVTILSNPPGFLRIRQGQDLASQEATSSQKIQNELKDLMPGVVKQLEPLPILGGIKERQYITIEAGDTLDGILQKIGLEADERLNVIKLLKPSYNAKDLKPGHQFEFALRDDGKLFSLRIIDGGLQDIWLRRASRDGGLKLETITLPLFKSTAAKQGTIHDSLYVDAIKQGLTPNLVADMIRIFSYDVDFQRDIWEGDEFSVLYDQSEDRRGETQDQIIIAASLTLRGKEIRYYRYDVAKPDARIGGEFYGKDGKTAKKALLRTPIDGARLSSRFGMRKHPVLGYNKMHKGIDFAASVGTPIYAAGDGVIEYAGRFSSYGNYVRIRHNNSLETAYAHMKGFAKGIKVGARVRQYQIVGWVGMTGRTTGPHLHFELLRGGSQINPLTVTAQTGESLKGKQLATFQQRQAELDEQWQKSLGQANLPQG